MKNRSFVVAASFVLALVLASAKDARAVEHQHHLGLDGGLSMLKIDDKDSLSVGGGVGAHYAYGLTDQFNLMVEGATNVVALGEFVGPGFSTKHPSGVDSLGVGLGYVLDITRVVPYGGLLLTGFDLRGGSLPNPLFVGGGTVALGVDYQFTRSFAAGVALRQHFLLTQISSYPSYTNAFLRIEYTWGW
ncbi:MAG TPA: outer membrane beta-barrel protein [Polyangiaceae bacterium]